MVSPNRCTLVTHHLEISTLQELGLSQESRESQNQSLAVMCHGPPITSTEHVSRNQTYGQVQSFCLPTTQHLVGHGHRREGGEISFSGSPPNRVLVFTSARWRGKPPSPRRDEGRQETKQAHKSFHDCRQRDGGRGQPISWQLLSSREHTDQRWHGEATGPRTSANQITGSWVS